MTRARTLADMISDGVIGTTELADDAITPVKLDETGNYTIAQLDVNGTVTSDGLTVAGIATVQDSDVRIDLTAAPSASGEVIGDLYFRSENSYGGRQDAGLIRSISASNWNVSREAAMEFHTTYNSNMNKRMRINNNGDIVFYNADGSTASFLYDADVGTFFNYAGQNRDFRVSSDNQTNLFAIDGESDKIGLGRFPLSGGSGNTAEEGAIQIADGLGTVPLFINGGADYAGMKLKRDGTNAAGGTDGWNWTIRPSYAAGVASGGDISYLKINSVYDAAQGGQQQHEVVFNEDQYNLDFRVESDNNANMFFVDASTDRVGINQSSPQAMLDIKGNTTTYTGMSKIYLTDVSGNPSSRNWAIGNGGSGYGNFTIGVSNVATGDPMANGTHKTPFIIQPSGSVVINDDSNDADFRVESDGVSNMLLVDAGNNSVAINRSYGIAPLHVSGSASNTITPANAYAKITDQGLDGLAFGSISSSPFSAWIQSGYTSNSYSPDWNNGYPLLLNPIGGRVGINVSDNPDAELHISGSHPHIDLGPKGGNRAKLGFRYDNLYLGATSAGGEVIIKNNVGSTDAPDASGDEIARLGDDVVFNESGRDQDFRVESDGATHMLYVDAGNDCVNIATTQTVAMFGGGKPSSGYVQQFSSAKMIKFAEFGASSSTGSETITVVINLNRYRSVCVRINTSGHYYNNGGAFYNRVNEFFLATEGTASRINSRVDIVAAGSAIGSCGVPSASISATDQFSITQAIGAGYTANVFIEVTGLGSSSIGNITKA